MLRRVLISAEYVVLFLPPSILLLLSPIVLHMGGLETLTQEIGIAIGGGIVIIGSAGACGLYVAQNLAAHVISSTVNLYSVPRIGAGLMAGIIACVFAIWAYSNWYTSLILCCPIVGALHFLWRSGGH